MKKLSVLAGLPVLLGVLVVAVVAAEEKPLDKGQQAYLDAKCNMCHGVSTAGIEAKTKSEKMKGPDLVNLAKRKGLGDATAIGVYLKGQSELDGKQHKKPFKGSDEELQVLVDWLLEQKAEG